MDNPNAKVGVGLRHEHFDDVLRSADEVDFVEVHAENFFMDGGLALSLLDNLQNSRLISIHGTSLGLGSRVAIPDDAITSFKRLIDRVNPILVSDHAAFCWYGTDSRPQHSGDLLPIEFSAKSLTYLTRNIDRVQQSIGRRLFVENLATYLTPGVDTLKEYEFLQQACYKTGAGLLLDLNNLFVNSFNSGSDHLPTIREAIDHIDPALVGEIHLAGCTVPDKGKPMIDDHSRSVPEIVWSAYEYALGKFGPVPTLVEWDTDLPAWSTLVDEAIVAHSYMHEICR